MLLKRWRWAQARSCHASSSHVRSPCPHAVVVAAAPAARRGCGIDILARLDFSSKCLSKPRCQLAPCGIYSRVNFSVDCRRLSTGHTRSSIAHHSHDEAPCFNDGRCPAASSWCACVPVHLRAAETFHQEWSFPRLGAVAVVGTLSSESCVVLAGGHDCCNRMASSRCISVWHAVPVGPSLGGRDFFDGWAAVLVAHPAVFTERTQLASMVDGFVPLSRYATL